MREGDGVKDGLKRNSSRGAGGSISDHPTLGLVQPPADDFTNSHNSNIPRYSRGSKQCGPVKAAAMFFINSQK